MKIALVTDAWRPQVNGVVTTLLNTTAQLGELGHEVHPVTPDGFRTYPCPTEPELRLAMFPRRRVRRMLDEIAPDAVHLATEGPLGIAARKFCLRRRWPFTTSYCTKFPEYLRERAHVPVRVGHWWFRRFHRHAHRVMVSTDTLAAELRALGYPETCLWPRGVDTDLFRPRPEARETLLADLPRPLTMYMGRVALEKNIQAFLRLDLPGSKVVIGDGPAMTKVQREFPDAHFLGFKMGEDLATHLACADCFVFPSRTDTFGLVMLEALACGVPVAAFPVAGPIDAITDERVGALREDLREAVLTALELDREACRAYALERSWRRVAEHFASNLAPISR